MNLNTNYLRHGSTSTCNSIAASDSRGTQQTSYRLPCEGYIFLGGGGGGGGSGGVGDKVWV
jgi:hypothetical protein